MKKSKISLIISLFIFLGLIVSCQEEVDFEPSLFTEEVLYLSAERARLLGRVITNQNIEASDHGFQISESEQFSQPIVISLGERTGPGRFIGETDQLEPGKRYFARAFLTTTQGELFGNAISLESLVPAALNMVPNNGKSGIQVTISGRNFGSDVEVFFGSNRGQVVGVDFESSIRVIVPAPTLNPVVQVRVISQGTEMFLPMPFEYTTGSFASVGQFPGGFRLFDNIALQEGDQWYVGLGNITQGFAQNLYDKFWKYDSGVGTWQEVLFPGGFHLRAFSTGKYFGGGLQSFSVNVLNATFDFWKLENGAFVKLPNLPRPAYLSAAFETSEAVYILGGGFGLQREILEFSKSTETWKSMNPAPFDIDLNVMNFHYQGRQYFINPANKVLHIYDPALDSWSTAGVYPGIITNSRGLGVTLGDFAYVGLENRSEQIWELDLRTLNWVAKNDFPGLGQAFNVGVFNDSEKIFILRNGEIQISGPMQIWQFDPRGF